MESADDMMVATAVLSDALWQHSADTKTISTVHLHTCQMSVVEKGCGAWGLLPSLWMSAAVCAVGCPPPLPWL